MIHVYDSPSNAKNEDEFEATAKLFLERHLHINLVNKDHGHSPALNTFSAYYRPNRLTTERHLGSKEILRPQ